MYVYTKRKKPLTLKDVLIPQLYLIYYLLVKKKKRRSKPIFCKILSLWTNQVKV